jgi:beta-glucanase (GH16 family)
VFSQLNNNEGFMNIFNRKLGLNKTLLSCCAGLFLSASAQAVVFQAENYNTYNDTTPGNSGGAYRTDNVDIEATNDVGGGFDIGWIAQGEWWSYSNLVISSTGSYTINMRVASPTGGTASVDLNGGATQLGNFVIPATGGWQTWTTVSRTVTLNAGTYNLGVFAQTAGWNYNWIEVVPNAQSSSSSSASSAPKWSLLVQAEEYSTYYDTTVGNAGGAYRKDNVDIEATSDQGGGYDVGWIAASEWLAYSNITIPTSGTYTVRMRVASPAGATAAVDLNAGSIPLGDIAIPATGGYQTWVTVSRTVTINAGTYALGVFAKTGDWNFNWIEITSDNSGGSSSSSNSSTPGNMTWNDEFNTINSAVWSDQVGDNQDNHEREYYTAGNNEFIQYDSSIGSNVLVLEARKENPANYNCWYGRCEYTSARLNTKGKKSFQYGRIEARMKLPHTQGIWPAFWMLGDDINSVGWPNCGEIDIMEHVGFSNEAKTVHGTIHGPNYSGANGIGNPYTLAENVDAGYHVYAVDWTATSIKWYVDGVLYFTQTKAQVETKGNWAFSHPFYIILNNAVGGDWPRDPDGSSVFPQRVYIDYIRVYQ